MKNIIVNALMGIIAVVGIVFGFMSGINFSNLQLETLSILAIVCGASIAYCFIVGEITRNNSQMDKLWSILPIAYVWIIAAKSGFNLRVVLFSIIATLWGIRLTANFARKGAYSIKFWTGEEDYRWPILRSKKPFTNKFVWALFDLLFISFYQNALVLLICLPLLSVMESTNPLMWVDFLALALMLFFLIYETIADEQQMRFHTTKRKLLNEGKTLEELPSPYNLGFNTTGLWNFSRHPNYLAEQSIWVCLYFSVVGAGVVSYGIFNWTIVGCLMLILLFMGSSMMAEIITSKKYPKYKEYLASVEKYLPIRRYRK